MDREQLQSRMMISGKKVNYYGMINSVGIFLRILDKVYFPIEFTSSLRYLNKERHNHRNFFVYIGLRAKTKRFSLSTKKDFQSLSSADPNKRRHPHWLIQKKSAKIFPIFRANLRL